MAKDIDFKVYLEEYKKIFIDFFSVSNNYSVKLIRSFGMMVNMPKELTPAKFIINNKELLIDGCVNFDINGIWLRNVSKMERDNRKIKIYNNQILLGVFYLQKHINIKFSIEYYENPFKLFSIDTVYINGIIDKFNYRNSKNYYEIKFLHQYNSSQRIMICSNDYKENIEKIIHYTRLYNLLEIVFDKEKIHIPTFCINGMYNFNIIKLKINANYVELSYNNGDKISVNLGINIVKLTMKNNIIFISLIVKSVSEIRTISNKDNLVLGYSIYE